MRAQSFIRVEDGSQSARVGLTIALAAMLLAVGGCDKKVPEGQTVAVVNGDVITASDLKLELSNLPPAAREQSKAQVLQAMIDRRLLASDATAQKRDKVPAFVLQERRMREVMLAQQTITAFAQSSRQPISQTDVNAYLDRHPAIGNERRILIVNQMQFQTPPKPVLDAMRPAKTMAELIAVLESRRIPAQRGRTQIDTAMLPDVELERLAKMAPGEPLVVVNGPSTVVSEIAAQRPAPLSEADQQKIARSRIEAERAQGAVKQQTDALRQAATITYNDAYKPKAAAPAKQ